MQTEGIQTDTPERLKGVAWLLPPPPPPPAPSSGVNRAGLDIYLYQGWGRGLARSYYTCQGIVGEQAAGERGTLVKVRHADLPVTSGADMGLVKCLCMCVCVFTV